jgi:hypothetical protein
VARWNLAHLHKYLGIVAWYCAGHHGVSSNVRACWSQVVTNCLAFPYPVSAPFGRNRSPNVEAVYKDTMYFRGRYDRPLDAQGGVLSFDALFGLILASKSTFWSKVRQSSFFLQLVSERLRHRPSQF